MRLEWELTEGEINSISWLTPELRRGPQHTVSRATQKPTLWPVPSSALLSRHAPFRCGIAFQLEMPLFRPVV
jgi:hypothetical protein